VTTGLEGLPMHEKRDWDFYKGSVVKKRVHNEILFLLGWKGDLREKGKAPHWSGKEVPLQGGGGGLTFNLLWRERVRNMRGDNGRRPRDPL